MKKVARIGVCGLVGLGVVVGIAQGPRSPEGQQGLLKVAPIRVIGSHEVAITFPARMPYGRQSKVKVEADGVEVSSGESAAYDVLLPDFVTDSEVDGATLVIASEGEDGAAKISVRSMGLRVWLGLVGIERG